MDQTELEKRKERAKQQLAKVREKLARLEAAERKGRRKEETRVKIIIGAAAIQLLRTGRLPALKAIEALRSVMSERDADTARIFLDELLKVSPAAPVAAQAEPSDQAPTRQPLSGSSS